MVAMVLEGPKEVILRLNAFYFSPNELPTPPFIQWQSLEVRQIAARKRAARLVSISCRWGNGL